MATSSCYGLLLKRTSELLQEDVEIAFRLRSEPLFIELSRGRRLNLLISLPGPTVMGIEVRNRDGAGISMHRDEVLENPGLDLLVAQPYWRPAVVPLKDAPRNRRQRGEVRRELSPQRRRRSLGPSFARPSDPGPRPISNSASSPRRRPAVARLQYAGDAPSCQPIHASSAIPWQAESTR